MLTAENVIYTYKTRYQTVYAVNDVSAEFEAGKFYAIVGASGSGKTTLLSLLAGLDVPAEGTIAWEGQATAKLDRDDYRFRHVSMIYQNYNLFYHLTVLENAAYPLLMQKLSKAEAYERATAALRSVGLDEQYDRRLPNMLSGGEQQRVAIARALVTRPSILLADEPTGALDQHTGRQIMELFEELHEEGNTILMITHDLSVAKHARRVVHIIDGELTEAEEATFA